MTLRGQDSREGDVVETARELDLEPEEGPEFCNLMMEREQAWRCFLRTSGERGFLDGTHSRGSRCEDFGKGNKGSGILHKPG